MDIEIDPATGLPVFRPDGAVLTRFMADVTSRASVIQGPIGSGKTLGCMMKIWMCAMAQRRQRDGYRRARAHVFRDTYQKLKDTTLKSWQQWFPESLFGKFYASPPLRHEIRCGDVELDVHFVALEDEWNVDYFRSLDTTLCYFNELQYLPRLLFDEAVSRVGRYPRTLYFNLFIRTRGARLAGGFVTFVTSQPGQQLVLASGRVPTAVPLRFVHRSAMLGSH